MTFDAARGVTVLFGGHRDLSGYNAQLGDTWEWNGSYWVEHFGVAGPAPRSEHRMTYDAPRQRTVLCGGRAIYGGGASYTDTWEWNGSAWTNMQAVAPVSSHAALAFDAARQRTVLFGGKTDGGVESNGTWAYSAQNGPFASIVPYGSGCAGPTGVPLLAVLPGSLPRLGATLALEVSNLPTGLLNVPVGWLGFDDATWGGAPLPLALDGFGFPGCVALLAPSTEYSLTNVAGTASWSIPIPFLPSYAGLQFYLQAGVLVLGFNPGGLVFSRALHGTVGI